jgi:hypothetical protein
MSNNNKNPQTGVETKCHHKNCDKVMGLADKIISELKAIEHQNNEAKKIATEKSDLDDTKDKIFISQLLSRQLRTITSKQIVNGLVNEHPKVYEVVYSTDIQNSFGNYNIDIEMSRLSEYQGTWFGGYLKRGYFNSKTYLYIDFTAKYNEHKNKK